MSTTETPGPFHAIPISESVYWVGALDWAVRDFHGYATPYGTTYNAYLVLDEQVTLIDGVKQAFVPELLSRVASIVDPGRIDLIISNHSEPDHSSGLPAIIDAVKPKRVLASTNGVKALNDYYGLGDRVTAVADGESLSLGRQTVTFLETKMLHWPDSMVTWLTPDNVLVSNDIFGMHLCSSARFADEIPEETLWREGATYYANIILPYSSIVLRQLEQLAGLNLPIATIAPDHGPIWRKDPQAVVERYMCWARQARRRKAAVVYDTMWESTALMARAIADGLAEGGATAVLLPLHGTPRSEVATELLDAGALLVGSPTLNNGMFPTVADVLTYVKGLKPRNLIGAAFGSFGWSGEAVKQIEEVLTAMDVSLISPGLRTRYRPTAATLAECRALGLATADALKERGLAC
jgi:flavorubredoxin